MPQHEDFRKGWNNEKLANYLLSQFSFTAQPTNTGDDVGIDFFCTTFQKKDKMLYPRSSFAIQVKSNRDAFDITDKMEFFYKLELPYYVGVVDNDKRSMEIYSGEYINNFLMKHGPDLKNYKVKISLLKGRYVNHIEDRRLFFRTNEKKKIHYINFYPIYLLGFNNNNESNRDIFFNNISIIQKNISRRVTGSYLFEIDINVIKMLGVDYDPNKRKYFNIFAGKGSLKVFLEGLYNRYTEAFYFTD